MQNVPFGEIEKREETRNERGREGRLNTKCKSMMR